MKALFVSIKEWFFPREEQEHHYDAEGNITVSTKFYNGSKLIKERIDIFVKQTTKTNHYA